MNNAIGIRKTPPNAERRQRIRELQSELLARLRQDMKDLNQEIEDFNNLWWFPEEQPELWAMYTRRGALTMQILSLEFQLGERT